MTDYSYEIYCPEHGVRMWKTISHYNLLPYYRCGKFPVCQINYGIGGFSTKELRKYRQEAHRVIEKIFGCGKDLKKIDLEAYKHNKKEMYKWLSQGTGGKTFSDMSSEELKELMRKLLTYAEPRLEIAVETKTLIKSLIDNP
jgi:hypothetical protein